MDNDNPLAQLPAEVLEQMDPAERLAYLIYAEEQVPTEVTEAARRVFLDRHS